MNRMQMIKYEARFAMQQLQEREDWLIEQLRPFVSPERHREMVARGDVGTEMVFLKAQGITLEEEQNWMHWKLFKDGKIIGEWKP